MRRNSRPSTTESVIADLFFARTVDSELCQQLHVYASFEIRSTLPELSTVSMCSPNTPHAFVFSSA